MRDVRQIEPKYLTNFTLPKGSGDKVLLRQVAESLGLKESHLFKKRAIQFGTSISKQFPKTRHTKGTQLI